MAPPISRRSKQNSPTSPAPPIPLPGIALGLFAAIAAGFATSRALRRKRHGQSLQDKKQSISACTLAPTPLLVQEREIEIKEKDDGFNASAILVNANGTITIAHETSKLEAGLKPVFDAFEEVLFVQKTEAKPLEDEGRREDEERKGEEEDGQRDEAEKEQGKFEENEKKKGETVETGEEGEIVDITVKIEASLVVNEASVEALQRVILEQKEEEEEEEEEDEEEEEAEGKGEDAEDDLAIDVEADTGHDGDDDRSSSDQQPSPVLINGRILDFFEEIPDIKDDPDHLSSGSTWLSDSVSESSMQEVSSVPVKPFVPTEEILEASWPGAKPDFFVTLNQSGQEIAFSENKNWSDNEKNLLPLEDDLSEMKKKVPECAENLSETDQNFIELKHHWAISNDDALRDVDVGLLNLKPVLVEIEEKESSVDKTNEMKFGVLSNVMDPKGNSIALEGEVSIKVIGFDEGIAESTTINGKVLSNGSPLSEELDDLESIGGCEHVLQSTREIANDFTSLTCKGEENAESVPINGMVFLDESPDDPSKPKGMTADETSSQTGQEATYGTISGVHGSESDLLATNGLSGDKTCVICEGELCDDELTKEVACLGIDASEKLVIVEGILEELMPQCAAQKLGIVDDTRAENNVNLEQEQSSSFIASKGITEGKGEDNVELSSGREDIDDVISEQILVEGTISAKEQEIQEIMKSCDANDLIFDTKKLASLADSTHLSYNDTSDVDSLVTTGAIHHHGLQPKGGLSSKILQYLPLEIGFLCLLIALVSFVLWYLEVSPLIRS